LILSVPDEEMQCALNLISTFDLYKIPKYQDWSLNIPMMEAHAWIEEDVPLLALEKSEIS
jgi:hypothetical protein